MTVEKPYRIGITGAMSGDPKFLAVDGPLDTVKGLAGVPGCWIDDDGVTMLPATRLNAMTVEALAVPASVAEEYRQWRAEAMKPNPLWTEVLHHRVLLAKRQLLGHQADFLAILMGSRARGILNASEQGTGKTCVGWLALQLWGAKRALIVCPKSLMWEWVREWRELWGPLNAPINPIVLDKGSKCSRVEWLETFRGRSDGQPTAVILNYEMLAPMEKAIREYAPDAIVLDEVFRCKNPDAAVTKAAIRIADKADHVLALTGTPIANHIGDLWSQLRLLGKETMPESHTAFLHRYAILEPLQLGPRTVWKPVGVSDPLGLMQRIEPVWYRATKAACLNLPPKQYREVRLTMRPETRELYEKIRKEGTAALGNSLSLDSEAVVGIRLHQLAGGFAPYYHPENDKAELSMLPCVKIDWLNQFAKDTLRDNPTTRCIVWAAYTAELERITATLRQLLGDERVQMCWGGSDNAEIEGWKESFQSRSEGGVQVLVCQLQKMAYGHNLQATDINVYFSNNWSYVIRSQSEDRSHRNGRADAVQYIDLTLQQTVDEDILEALKHKADYAYRFCPDTSGSRS